jgi:hypothetical protein
VQLIGENAGAYAWVVVHQAGHFVGFDVEDAQPRQFTVVGHRQDDRDQAIGPQREVAPSVLPDDGPRSSRSNPAVFFSSMMVYGLVFARCSFMYSSLI